MAEDSSKPQNCNRGGSRVRTEERKTQEEREEEKAEEVGNLFFWHICNKYKYTEKVHISKTGNCTRYLQWIDNTRVEGKGQSECFL